MTLTLLPAVDVADGQAVRLVQGAAGSETHYGAPLDAAMNWQNAGAEWIHLVDLDAAFGRGSNYELLKDVVGKLDVDVELSGGIRDTESLEAALATGCRRVNIGTAALEHPEWCKEIIGSYGDRVAIGLDVRQIDGEWRLRGRGWVSDGGDLWEVLERLELRGVRMDEDENIRIGSLTSFSHITRDPIIQKYINVLGEAVDMVGGPQIRNIGTIGGNTCNGVTSADSSSTLHAWDAIVELTGKNGVRRLPIHEFYIKAGKVDIRVEDGEIQTAILIPKESYDRCWGHYIKYAMRNAMDIATLGCSVNVRLSADKKTIERARIAYGVAGPVPLRCATAEAAAQGKPLTEETVDAFANAILSDINPRDSWRASKAFRQHIALEIAKRCLVKSIELAGGELA